MIDMHPHLRNLQLRGDPDNEATDVDEAQYDGYALTNLGNIAFVDHEETDSIDDDTAAALNLNDPKNDRNRRSALTRSKSR